MNSLRTKDMFLKDNRTIIFAVFTTFCLLFSSSSFAVSPESCVGEEKTGVWWLLDKITPTFLSTSHTCGTGGRNPLLDDASFCERQAKNSDTKTRMV